jgi:hypothetical protein
MHSLKLCYVITICFTDKIMPLKPGIICMVTWMKGSLEAYVIQLVFENKYYLFTLY